jgi:hypothetical protein
MLAAFDLTMQDYVGCITTKVICECYFGPHINEVVSSEKVVHEMKMEEYFSVILDCTSDQRDQEKMSIVL